jgi:hypothetical protein
MQLGLRLYDLPEGICQLCLLVLKVAFQLPVLLLKRPHFLADFIVPVGHHIDLVVAFLQLIVVLFLIALLGSDLFLQQLNHALVLLYYLLELGVFLLGRTRQLLVLLLTQLLGHLESCQLHAHLGVTLHQLFILADLQLQLLLGLRQVLPYPSHLQLH